MRVVGFDLSLTATGVADEGGECLIQPNAGAALDDRLWHLHWEFERAIHTADMAVVEDLPRNARYGGVALGMVHAVFRLSWHEVTGNTHDRPIIWVAPASLKLYATGKGNAGKDQMLTEAVRRLGYEGHDHNEADAMWLRAIGMDVLGTPLCSLPATHRKALEKLTLPADLAAQ